MSTTTTTNNPILNTLPQETKMELTPLQKRINARKSELNQVAEQEAISDSTLDMLANVELESDFINKVEGYCSTLELLRKTSGVANDWKVQPKYHFGSLGLLAKFLTLWVYLPDALKEVSGLSIPLNAFKAEDLDAWGSPTYCTKAGQVVPLVRPDFEAVKVQAEMLRIYLNLGVMPKMLTDQQFDKIERRAYDRAYKAEAEIALANEKVSQAKALGLATFVV